MKNLLFVIACLCLAYCSPKTTAPKNSIESAKLLKLWESDSTLKVPESVLPDERNKVLYVSNIDGKDPWGKDGFGSITKLGFDGQIIEQDWITGLNAPKGMGIHKGKLFVADLTDLVIIDIGQNKIEKVVPISSAQGLNDISISKDGAVYISDSKAKIIYKYLDGKTDVVIKDLKGPNGVLFHNNSLFILDAGGFYKLNSAGTLDLITEGMAGGTDGLEPVGDGNYILSAWAGTIWIVSPDGNKKVLLDTREQKINTADIGITTKDQITIYVPTFWKNSVVAYRLDY